MLGRNRLRAEVLSGLWRNAFLAALVLSLGSLTIAGNHVVSTAALGPTPPATLAAQPPTYSITFIASGLSAGSSWNLTISGQTYTTNQSSQVIQAANGTYGYSAYAATSSPPRYVNGTVVVNGAPQTVQLGWGSQAAGGSPGISSPSASSGPGGVALWEITAIVLVFLAVGLLVRRASVRGQTRAPDRSPPERPSEIAHKDLPPGIGEPEDPLSHML